TIKPEPVAVATPSDTEICDDGSFTVGLETNGTSIAADHYLVTTAVSDPGLTQTSGNVTVGGTVMLAGPTNTISGTFSNATTSTQTVTYTIVPVSADGCEGDAITVEVDVWARPVTMPGPAAICLGDITDILPNVTQGSGTSVSNYAWTYLGATATNFNVNDPPVFPLFPNLTVINTENLAIDVSSPLAGQGLIGFSLVVTDDNGCTSLP
ncbi:MAG: hypothetical protein KDD12_27845, partial [Lewinella sp.]|nr:hypothetical protein [Lewinella sp.]